MLRRPASRLRSGKHNVRSDHHGPPNAYRGRVHRDLAHPFQHQDRRPDDRRVNSERGRADAGTVRPVRVQWVLVQAVGDFYPCGDVEDDV